MIIYWLASYIIGNFLTAWWVGKWKGVDLRQELSGNLGARNAGAVIGKWAFALTFLGDAAKAVLVIIIGRCFNFDLNVIAIACLAVICGHLFPIWLKGRGGKGIASFIGATLVLTPHLFLIMFIVFVLLFFIIKSATLTMLASFAAFLIAMVAYQETAALWPLVVALLLIVVKHKKDIKESFTARCKK